ncbi:hypothetical protein [Actinoallomurus sp. NPDC052274]|uniref:hypothetical protein n=1 Tax=Actinoallomurus sp. NPDC052274 TaxID=3155420 RepID=UPI0034125712
MALSPHALAQLEQFAERFDLLDLEYTLGCPNCHDHVQVIERQAMSFGELIESLVKNADAHVCNHDRMCRPDWQPIHLSDR